MYHHAIDLRFAVAGVPLSTPKPGGTVAGIKHAAKLGIKAMEMEWVQNVPMNPERMAEIRSASKEYDVALTVHAPYYVNFNSAKPETFDASIVRVCNALAMAQLAGARSVCVHAAFNHGQAADSVHANVAKAVALILKQKKRFPDVNLALETMGKPTQWGTLEEVLAISKEFDMFPCIDSAHMHARTNGGWNTAEEWNRMFDLYAKALGKKSLQSMHLHYCGIAYGPNGEKHHLALKKSDANWKEFLTVLKKRAIGGCIVVESPIQEKDTLLLQKTFRSL